MTDEVEIKLEIRSNPLYLSGARELVASVARRLCFTEEACGQIALALDEALCNVIRHGYQRQLDRPIWISITPIGGVGVPDSDDCPTTALRIIIEDEAAQVEPDVIRGRDLDEIRPGGLGVHIIQSVMDEVQYEHRDGEGMRLTLLKRRVPPDAAGNERPQEIGASSHARDTEESTDG